MQPASWTVSSRDIWITLWGRHRPYASNADKVHEYTQTTERELPRTNYLYGQSSVAVNKSTALPFPDTGEPHTMNRFIGRMLWLYMKKTNAASLSAADGLSHLKQYEAVWPWTEYVGTVIKALWQSTPPAFPISTLFINLATTTGNPYPCIFFPSKDELT